ncbi:hypothetical protein DRE_06503 [Drechslerella stenobrocha 248]|uniref:NmrA-like domain-containing protein n=1 Tax=Drechslerella stenobrocha 248 TaxID=1043628 RepID=W7I6Z8_9PEZI|nr:hypothetical protein DRE_06503 [Drechslerella stenobrocha 248]
MTKPVVAVAGGTGTLGTELIGALLDPRFRSKYKDVIVLTRNVDTPQVAKWEQQGLLAREYAANDGQSVLDALSGVDILVNTVASKDEGFKSQLAAAIASTSSSVQLYLPSEFGVDHYIHDFKHPEWDKKKAHFEAVRQRESLKVCRVFPGLFTDHSIGPWFGFDTKAAKYEFIGTGDTPVSFTSIADIGKAVANAIANIPVKDFPEALYLCGDSASPRQLAGLASANGATNAEPEILLLEYPAYKERVVADISLNPGWYLRFLMHEGKIDNKDRNDNELVNPGERLWKWKTVKDQVEALAQEP